jgi:hypothetical protein
LVVIVRFKSVALFVMDTVALGTTAPDSSFTLPEIVPVGAWPYATHENTKSPNANSSDKAAVLDIGFTPPADRATSNWVDSI